MAEQGRSLIRVIGIIIIIIIFAAGISYGIMNYLLPGDGKAESVQEKKIGPTFTLGDFVVNLGGGSGYQYIKASIVVEISNSDLLKELEKRNPQIRDKIISILREQKLENIEEPGADNIKNQIKAELNRILNNGDITRVWFTQLVVQ